MGSINARNADTGMSDGVQVRRSNSKGQLGFAAGTSQPSPRPSRASNGLRSPTEQCMTHQLRQRNNSWRSLPARIGQQGLL